MLRFEISKLLKNRRFIFFAILIILVPEMDLLIQLKNQFEVGFDTASYITNPAMASFLAGNSIGHYGQMILIWLLPVILLNLYTDQHVSEIKNGYQNATLIRESRKKVYQTKLALSAIIPGLLVFISLLLNFVIALLVWHGGKDFSGMEDELQQLKAVKSFQLLVFQMKHPYGTMVIYIFIFTIMVAIFGMVTQAIVFMFPNYYIAYPFAFLLWIVQIMSPYSSTYFMQPFIEYGLRFIIPAIIIYLSSSLIVIGIGYFRQVKADVL
ncbi:Hypothetical protein ADU71_0262 [Pediococcus damnosus]|uniref:hypothetical protein n=1 Tax=Pediococcus damnosus TaxID=51663 RepID=UPI00078D554A|nr:hypothetical protein [Pediococcus damnosus]AMV59941.1 Hypothetical protein ADU69_0263 [Pediococcus damnosus]AMV64185.1 Hypothetical protein ADU71_0262 [Pediococcus damnosus]